MRKVKIPGALSLQNISTVCYKCVHYISYQTSSGYAIVCNPCPAKLFELHFHPLEVG